MLVLLCNSIGYLSCPLTIIIMTIGRSASTSLQYIEGLFCRKDVHRPSHDPYLTDVQVAPCEAQFISLLLNMISAKKVLEIGCLFGYSALYMAASMGEGAEVLSLEKDENRYKEAQKNISSSPYAKSVSIILGNAKDTLKELDDTFDAAFIDADKASYSIYFEHADRLVRKGGIIICDNVFLGGRVYETANEDSVVKKMRAFNERIAKNKKYNSVILPSADGMLVAHKIS